MSKTVFAWANDWIIEKLSTEEYAAPDGLVRSEVARFVDDAHSAGISREALESVLGDLDDFLAEEYERKIGEEAAERAGRGD